MEKKINSFGLFFVKLTELEWQTVIDDFNIKAPFKWFEFINWLIILGLLSYLTKTTQNIYVNVFYITSVVLIFNFLQTLFLVVIHQKMLGHQLAKKRIRLISYLVGALLTGISITIVNQVVEKLKSIY